ncbi:MAG: dockerin type I repeat-containing protein, partial [Clostridiaceae bacterium]|nr:dockerin type I repeat-containing protein [Clostridiaceae bacterium]
VLIYGDISGDGSITMVDTTALANSLNKSTTLTAAQKLAANVNGDRSVNLVDHTLLSNVIQKTATINQTTGKVV